MQTLGKIQIITRDLPCDNTIGRLIHIFDLIRYLQQTGFDIDVVWLSSSLQAGPNPWHVIPLPARTLFILSAQNHLRLGHVLFQRSMSSWIRWMLYDCLPGPLKSIFRFSKRGLKPLLRHLSTNTHKQLKAWNTLPTREEICFFLGRLSQFKPDVVIVDYAWLADVLDTTPGETVLKVIFTHEILHRIVADCEIAGIPTGHLDWDWEKEATQLRKAHVLLAEQQEDAEILKQMAPECDVICALLSATYLHSDPAEQVPGQCLYVSSHASFSVYGLNWLLEKVWPMVLGSVPYATLHVCGTVCDGIREPSRYQNVFFRGWVEDLNLQYRSAVVCLIPQFVRGGLKAKLVEALSHGRVCVSTTFGVQGLEGIVDKAIIVADDPEKFSSAVCEVLTNADRRQRMEDQARQAVMDQLSPETVYEPFLERIDRHIAERTSAE